MTFELASALLNRAANGDDLLQILDSIAIYCGQEETQDS